MKEFKELKEKIEKREEEFREELRPFAKERLNDKLLDLTMEEVEKLTEEEWAQFVNPDEKAINKEVEEMIAGIKNRLEEISKIEKATSLDELLTIYCSGNEELLKSWKDYLRKKGPEAVCELFDVWQYAPIIYVPENVEELIQEYRRVIARKAREFREKEN